MTEVLPSLKTKGPWIGFDLDGTLAEHGKYQGPDHIGTMIPKMKEILLECIRQGYRVKIMTARMGHAELRDEARTIIQDWLEANGLPRLEVTCKKDYKMIRLYDDRGALDLGGVVLAHPHDGREAHALGGATQVLGRLDGQIFRAAKFVQHHFAHLALLPMSISVGSKIGQRHCSD